MNVLHELFLLSFCSHFLCHLTAFPFLSLILFFPGSVGVNAPSWARTCDAVTALNLELHGVDVQAGPHHPGNVGQPEGGVPGGAGAGTRPEPVPQVSGTQGTDVPQVSGTQVPGVPQVSGTQGTGVPQVSGARGTGVLYFN